VSYEEQALALAKQAASRRNAVGELTAPEWVHRDAMLAQTYATLALMEEVRAVAVTLSQMAGS
jgi:hypothetical protein